MKKILIIGASRGIGLEMVNQLSNKGHLVLATVRQASDIKTLEQRGASPFNLDVSSASSIDAFANTLNDHLFDLIVYVAGVFGPRSDASKQVKTEEFDEVMHTNVLGAMQLIALLAPKIRPETGKFVFISSLMASMQATDSSSGWVYKTSKAALNMCVKAASASYPKICMLSMSPGWVKTDMGGEFAPLTPTQSVQALLQTIEDTTLMDSGRFINYNHDPIPY
jgi:NAD(P)-dependent dehydrogenase (short-subunit alcohol dehydrogenase family)